MQESESLIGIYEHYSGKRYEVIGVARFSEDPTQEFVVYKALYPSILETGAIELPVGSLWIRPKSMFLETITDQAGNRIRRFKKIQ